MTTAPAEPDRTPPGGRRPPLLPRQGRRSLVALVALFLVSLGLGGATSFGQTYLPEAISSVANSPSGWTASTVLLVWATRETSVLTAALAGVTGFAGLNLGYQLVSTARGYFYSGEFWFAVALLVGPFVGLAASWLHRRDLFAALGVGLVAAIGIADGLIGLLLQAYTSPVYWVVAILAAVLLLVLISVRRLRTPRLRWIAVTATAVLAGCYAVGLLVIA